uniref:Uncharacterized protein n=1 Tax=Rhizophora mucronata TaxID=61149 RepID=A0A2P2P1E1_RHIMU
MLLIHLPQFLNIPLEQSLDSKHRKENFHFHQPFFNILSLKQTKTGKNKRSN